MSSPAPPVVTVLAPGARVPLTAVGEIRRRARVTRVRLVHLAEDAVGARRGVRSGRTVGAALDRCSAGGRGDPIRAVHLMELRAAVVELEWTSGPPAGDRRPPGEQTRWSIPLRVVPWYSASADRRPRGRGRPSCRRLREATDLRPLVQRVADPLADTGIAWELLLVDNDSRDPTEVVAEPELRMVVPVASPPVT